MTRARSGGDDSCVVRVGSSTADVDESAAEGLSAVEVEGVRLAVWKEEAEGGAREGAEERGGWEAEFWGRRMSHSCCLSEKKN